MVSTCRKRHQNKKQISQLNETLNDLIIGNISNVDAIENATLELQTGGLVDIEEVPYSVNTMLVKIVSLKKILSTKLQRRSMMQL